MPNADCFYCGEGDCDLERFDPEYDLVVKVCETCDNECDDVESYSLAVDRFMEVAYA